VILDEIVAEKHRARAARDPSSTKRALAAIADSPPPRSLRDALSPTGAGAIRVIAEFKRRSPSAGAILPDGASVSSVAAAYAEAGAAALSILTDEKFFGGSLGDLASARRAAALPILRKDFALFDDDLADARAAGADAVLLIARLLDDRRLRALLDEAARLRLDALVEVHAAEECCRAVDAGALLVGVNHRDLDTLAIDLALSEKLAPLIPGDVVRVAESGLRTAADAREMAARGYHAVLVGEAFLRAPSPGAALRAWVSPCG